MATLRDVAAAADVSMSVASRALTGDPHARISAETRQRVIDLAEQLNYKPNHLSRALRSSRAGALALVVPDVTNSVFAELQAGVREATAQHEVSVFLGQLGRTQRKGRHGQLAELVGHGRVDGVILQRREDYDDVMLSTAINVNVPVVLFNSTTPHHVGSVILDDRSASRIATEHVVRLGHERIGFIGGSRLHDAAVRRERGFRDALRDAGISQRKTHVVAAGWEAPAGKEAMAKLLTMSKPPTAVVVASVNAAIGAASQAACMGVSIPEDLSLVGIQDTWYAEYFNPSLTVVRMPLRVAGRAAAEMILSHLDGGSLSDIVITDPPPQLVIRTSDAPPR